MTKSHASTSSYQSIFEIGRGLASAEIDAMHHNQEGTLKVIRRAQKALNQLEKSLKNIERQSNV